MRYRRPRPPRTRSWELPVPPSEPAREITRFDNLAPTALLEPVPPLITGTVAIDAAGDTWLYEPLEARGPIELVPVGGGGGGVATGPTPPANPSDGDLWFDGSNLQISIGGVWQPVVDLSGYVTTAQLNAALAGYLPLTGGTVTGPVILSGSGSYLSAEGGITAYNSMGINSTVANANVLPFMYNFSTKFKFLLDGVTPALTLQTGTNLNVLKFGYDQSATFGGPVILNADPTAALGAATKQYVDHAVTGGGGFIDAPTDGAIYGRGGATPAWVPTLPLAAGFNANATLGGTLYSNAGAVFTAGLSVTGGGQPGYWNPTGTGTLALYGASGSGNRIDGRIGNSYTWTQWLGNTTPLSQTNVANDTGADYSLDRWIGSTRTPAFQITRLDGSVTIPGVVTLGASSSLKFAAGAPYQSQIGVAGGGNLAVMNWGGFAIQDWNGNNNLTTIYYNLAFNAIPTADPGGNKVWSNNGALTIGPASAPSGGTITAGTTPTSGFTAGQLMYSDGALTQPAGVLATGVSAANRQWTLDTTNANASNFILQWKIQGYAPISFGNITGITVSPAAAVNGAGFGFSNTSNGNGYPFAQLTSDGTGIIAERVYNQNTANAFRVYNTYTDASNGEWGALDWQTNANQLTIGTQANGSGTLRNLILTGAQISLNGWTNFNSTVQGFQAYFQNMGISSGLALSGLPTSNPGSNGVWSNNGVLTLGAASAAAAPPGGGYSAPAYGSTTATYLTNAPVQGNASNYNANYLIVSLIYVTKARTFTTIGTLISGGGSAGATLFLGLYNLDDNGMPSTVIASQSIAIAAGGSQRLVSAPINVTLQPGFYGVASWQGTGGSTTPGYTYCPTGAGGSPTFGVQQGGIGLYTGTALQYNQQSLATLPDLTGVQPTNFGNGIVGLFTLMR